MRERFTARRALRVPRFKARGVDLYSRPRIRRWRVKYSAMLSLFVCLVGCSGGAAVEGSVTRPISTPPTPTPIVSAPQESQPPTATAEGSSSPTPTREPRPGLRTPPPDHETSLHRSVPHPSLCWASDSVLQRFHSPQVQDSVQWSPDGSAVFFTQGRNVYAVATDGTHVRQIVDPAPKGFDETQMRVAADRIGDMSAISVSPDGMQLLYSTCEYPRNYPAAASTEQDYQSDLALVRIAGGEPRRLTTHDAYDSFPVWSPDGARIAFLSTRHLRRRDSPVIAPHLYTMAPGGSDVRHLARTVVVQSYPPQWSPDGQWLAVVAREPEGHHGIYVVRADGTDVRRLAPAVSGPAWSPDGQRLAFVHPEQSTVVLMTIAVDGSDLQRVAPIDDWQLRLLGSSQYTKPAFSWIETVAWSPAGTQILVRPSVGVFVVGVDGSGRTDIGIVPVQVVDSDGRSQLAFERVRAAAWSPDGTRVVLVGPAHVATVAADGTDLQLLAQWGELGASWQPVKLPAEAEPVDVSGCSAGIAVPNPVGNPGLVADCATLLGVQQALAAGAALNWSVDRAIAEWDGVALGGSPLRVHEVHLGDPHSRAPRLTVGGLRRPLPAALAGLTELRVLRVVYGQFTGSIPSELGSLAQLRELILWRNDLTGPLPAALGDLAALRHLDVSQNRLTGPIPPELGRLAKLETFKAWNNGLTGPIPAEFGSLTQLRELWLGNNALSGDIPASLGELINLDLLVLGANALGGRIPTSLGDLRNLRLLDLSGNQLTGPIPPELGQLGSLVDLTLDGNRLTGSIPVEFAQLANVTGLGLSENQLTGAIPAEFGQLLSLIGLDLNNNHLTGRIPAQLGELESLSSLYLSGNEFVGCIPAALGRLEPRVSDLGELGLPYCEPAA